MSVDARAVATPFGSNPLDSGDHPPKLRRCPRRPNRSANTSTAEQWRPIDGWLGFYEESSRGRVRSVDHVIVDARGFTRRVRGQVLKLTAPTGLNRGGGGLRCSLSAPGRKQTYYPLQTLAEGDHQW